MVSGPQNVAKVMQKMLRLALDMAKAMALSGILMVSDKSNIASKQNHHQLWWRFRKRKIRCNRP